MEGLSVSVSVPSERRRDKIIEGPRRLQVGHLVEEARSKATSIQQSVSIALTGKSEEGFSMGMRSPLPSYAPQPAWVQFLKTGVLPPTDCLTLLCKMSSPVQHQP